MTNAELIKALRNCSSPTVGSCTDCPYYKGVSCKWQMMEDAADALEEAEARIAELEKQDSVEMHIKQVARIAELEAQLPKEGEWIPSMYTYPDGTTEHDKDEWYGELYECSICHYVMIGEVNYCPNCGAKMKTVTDCHTLEENERHEYAVPVA